MRNLVNEQVATADAEPYEDLVDDDDLLDGSQEDAGESLDHVLPWFPTEYVVAIVGHRGSGKSTLLAQLMLSFLRQGLPVYSSLELYPEKMGIDNKPHLLQLDNLLAFDASLEDTVIGIEELGTWIERLRGMSTTNILVGKFFQLFIRKKGLRIYFTNQSPNLPGWLWEQVDLIIYCQDMYYTEWGKESSLPKGTYFFYVARDVSGIFTGHPGTLRTFRLVNANKLWDKFNSYQMFDPFQWARKTIIKGGETVVDMDTGEAYGLAEEGLRKQQSTLQKYDALKTAKWAILRKTGFLDFSEGAVIDVAEGDPVFSVDGLRLALARTKGKTRQEMRKVVDKLMKDAAKGQIAWFGPGGKTIRLARPSELEGDKND